MSRVRVDPSLCEGSGYCFGLSKLFRETPQGTAESAITGELSPPQEIEAREAEDLCPVRAISMID